MLGVTNWGAKSSNLYLGWNISMKQGPLSCSVADPDPVLLGHLDPDPVKNGSEFG